LGDIDKAALANGAPQPRGDAVQRSNGARVPEFEAFESPRRHHRLAG
jgi:hypothetical protein